MERRQISSMGGNPIHLVGNSIQLGDTSPEFTVLDQDLMPKGLENWPDSYKLINVVPSLDTSVCDLQTKRFNTMAEDLGSDVMILTISMDLPFAQKRWCGANGLEQVITLSDHRDASFGRAFGVLIEELRLLNRSIFILDKENLLRYMEIVTENHNHPDYDMALAAMKEIRE